MKINLLALGLATVFSANLLAGKALNLKLVPERGCLLRHDPREVVIKQGVAHGLIHFAADL